jgi:thiol-disulfide isomerase/thioredoxin
VRRYLLISLAVLAVAFGLGAGIALLENPRQAGGDAGGESGLLTPADTLPEFSLPDLDGRPRANSEWSGQVLVVNFWATWCPPCRAETPGFVELQEKYQAQDVRFVGIAIDEREPVREFADSFGVNYPMLIGGLDAVELSKQLGNRLGGLPYTVIIDRRGYVRHRQPGEMPKERLDEILRSLL